MNVMPVVICYHTENWIRSCLESFHRNFPSKRILVVDNNPRTPDTIAEKRYVRSLDFVDVIPGRQVQHDHTNDYYDHGWVVDMAVERCRSQGVDVLLHLEPDCYCLGPRWYYNLLKPIRDGAWMSGGVRYTFGPIHPTPSMWLIDKIPGSFQHGHKGADLDDPMHEELVDLKVLADPSDKDYRSARASFYPEHWDTGLRNWFHCAKEGRAAHVFLGDFVHFRGGTDNSRETVVAKYKCAGLDFDPPFLPEARFPVY